MRNTAERDNRESFFDIQSHSEPLLTTEQLAKSLHVHEDSVRRWCSTHRNFPVVRLGSKNLYRISEVLAFFEEKRKW